MSMRVGKRKPVTRVIKVDEETFLVVKDMKHSLIESGVKKPTMCESLKVLLSHRQPGGWGHIVERATKNEEWRKSICEGG